MSKAGVIGLAFLSILLPSCSHESLDSITAQEEVPNEEDVIKAVFPVTQFVDEDGTRTTYSDDASGNFAWEAGDEIVILYNIKAEDSSNYYDEYDSAIATLYPVSGSEHIASISGISAKDIDSSLPCIAFYGIRYNNSVYNISSSVAFDYLSVPLESSEPVIDISTNHSSQSCIMALAAKYVPENKQFIFNHVGEGMIRFICNNVPTDTNYLSVSISETQNIYSNYGLTNFIIQLAYSKDEGSFVTCWDDVGVEPVKYLLSTGNGGNGIILNLPLYAHDETTPVYKDFTIAACAANGDVLATKTINATISLKNGWGYRYTVDFD